MVQGTGCRVTVEDVAFRFQGSRLSVQDRWFRVDGGGCRVDRGLLSRGRCRANVARLTQSRPDSGLGFQVNDIQTFWVVPSSLGRGVLYRGCMRSGQLTGDLS